MAEHAIRAQGSEWVVYRTDTGKVKSHHATKEKAEKSIGYIQRSKAEKVILALRGKID